MCLVVPRRASRSASVPLVIVSPGVWTLQNLPYIFRYTYTFPHFLFWKICFRQFICNFIQFDIYIHFMQRLANCVEVREKPGFRLCLHPFLVSDTTFSVSFQKHHEQATATILCFLPLMLTAIFLSLNYLLEALTNDKLVSISAVLPKNHH